MNQLSFTAIHRYKTKVGDEEIEHVEVFDNATVTYLINENGTFKLNGDYQINPMQHSIPIVPAAYFQYREFAEPRGVMIQYGPSNLSYDIISLLEELAKLISDNSNRLDVFCDLYLLFKGLKLNQNASKSCYEYKRRTWRTSRC
ncbi:phage portal protein [Bacillus wiedmannii]|uniref:Uncharacterized protein n=1 Tax=Bacillus wiedmannii TaxID=1890302 RepID=A0A2A7W023_9BACI|nr:phage portal protein [Bacillus wiedmannii]PEJ07933.1 hypothetical protein CN684_13895 [Bacillus wiedmannii]PHC72123.1 hypothetical protein COF35_01950 [Bacillus wiedmannii]